MEKETEVTINLSMDEAFDLVEYLSESDYPKMDSIHVIIEEINYQLEGVEPLDFA